MKKIITILFLSLYPLTFFAEDPIAINTSADILVVSGKVDRAEKEAHTMVRRQALNKFIKQLLNRPQERDAFREKKTFLWPELMECISSVTIINKQLTDQKSVLNFQASVAIDPGKVRTILEKYKILTTDAVSQKRVLVVVAEKIMGIFNQLQLSENMSQVETSIVGELRNKGFQVIDNGQLKQKMIKEQNVQKFVNNEQGALALAFQYGSDLLLTGKAVCKQASVALGDLKTNIANVHLTLIQADTAKVLASASATATQPHIDELTGGRLAIGAAAKKALEELFYQYDKNKTPSLHSVEFTISGVNHYQLALLKKLFKEEFSSIKNITQRNFMGNLAKLEITSRISAEKLADELVLKNFDSFTFRVDSLSTHKIEATLIVPQQNQ